VVKEEMMQRNRNARQGAGDGYRHPEINVPPFDTRGLLGEPAEKLAKKISDRNLSKHQLRRFYSEVKSIEQQLKAHSDIKSAWAAAYPRIKLIKAKAIYNNNRKQHPLPAGFTSFLKQSVDKIPADFENGTKNFQTFCQLFEAVVGYASEHIRND
jgi:CRISPR type III-A-associated protein Csm2